MRKNQFNIQTTHMSDEIYLIFERLAKEKRLSVEVVRWAEFFHGYQGKQSSSCSCDEILSELKSLKRLFTQPLSLSSFALDVENKSDQIIDSLSSDKAFNTIDDDELDYNF